MPSFAPMPVPVEGKSIEQAWRELLTGSATATAEITHLCEKYMLPSVIWYLTDGKPHTLPQLVAIVADLRAKFTLLHLRVRDYVSSDLRNQGWKKVAVRYESASRCVEGGRVVRQECMQFLTVDGEGRVVKGSEICRVIEGVIEL
ncbi:hypothetical protein LTR86_003800 [Recurvomyces mirabilis]|nr:hypothetical protein LTR86_003800 [Recurvomyces mirabilis]